jgi:hypothetical protein
LILGFVLTAPRPASGRRSAGCVCLVFGWGSGSCSAWSAIGVHRHPETKANGDGQMLDIDGGRCPPARRECGETRSRSRPRRMGPAGRAREIAAAASRKPSSIQVQRANRDIGQAPAPSSRARSRSRTRVADGKTVKTHIQGQAVGERRGDLLVLGLHGFIKRDDREPGRLPASGAAGGLAVIERAADDRGAASRSSRSAIPRTITPPLARAKKTLFVNRPARRSASLQCRCRR